MGEIATADVVPRVSALPKVIRSQRKDSAGITQQVIRPPAAKERVMPTVVLDDKDPYQESRGGHSEQEREPIRPRNAQVHQVPNSAKGEQRINDLPTAFPSIWKLVLGQLLSYRKADFVRNSQARLRGIGHVDFSLGIRSSLFDVDPNIRSELET